MSVDREGIALTVGVAAAHGFWEIGPSSFLHSFFSTISCRLEPDGWGTRFPVTMGDLYEGNLSTAQISAARAELQQAEAGLKSLSPEGFVWDFENLEAQPPQDVADVIASAETLAQAFVTIDGRSFFEVFFAALADAEEAQDSVRIIEAGEIGA